VVRFSDLSKDSLILPHARSAKALCSPQTTILRVLGEPELRFFTPRRVLHRLSDEQKAEKAELSQHILDMMQGLGPKQQKDCITGKEFWIYWDNRVRECGRKTEMSFRKM
jgi:hypothetical protein